MCAEVGHRTAAEIPEPAPTIEFLFGEWLRRSVAQPLLPVESLCIDWLKVRPRLVVLPPVGADLRNAANASALDEFDGVAKVAPASLLHAALKNALIGTNRVDERRAFFDRVRNWFFEVHVLPGGERGDGHGNVPVIGRADEDSIQLLIEDFAKIHVRSGEALGALLDGVAARSVNIAHCDDLVGEVAGSVGSIEQIVHAAAGADDADAQRIVCAENTRGCQGGEARGDEKIATIRRIFHGGILTI